MIEQQVQLPNTQNKTRIMIVDDHPIVRRGLVLLINQEADLAVTAEAENAEQALDGIGKQHFDLAIVDISLSGTNGVELTETIKTKYPNLPVLILTMHDEARYARSAFCAGARGYVTKRDAAETIVSAIRLVRSGKNYVSDNMARKLSESTVPACKTAKSDEAE
ncbi:MAG TPA: response regulator transcription factor [Sedimentisphaerales bacterium]|nr:response regulator transcription factor [Sedimentisphaerales bacterium]